MHVGLCLIALEACPVSVRPFQIRGLLSAPETIYFQKDPIKSTRGSSEIAITRNGFLIPAFASPLCPNFAGWNALLNAISRLSRFGGSGLGSWKLISRLDTQLLRYLDVCKLRATVDYVRLIMEAAPYD